MASDAGRAADTTTYEVGLIITRADERDVDAHVDIWFVPPDEESQACLEAVPIFTTSEELARRETARDCGEVSPDDWFRGRAGGYPCANNTSGVGENDERATTEVVASVACARCGRPLVKRGWEDVAKNEWFCNETMHKGLSCVVGHLRDHYNCEVRAHPASPLRGARLECALGGETHNVFELGILPLGKESGHVVCAIRVAQELSREDEWQPFIQHGALSGWLSGQSTLPENMVGLVKALTLAVKADARPKFKIQDRPQYGNLEEFVLTHLEHLYEVRKESRREHDAEAQPDIKAKLQMLGDKLILAELPLRDSRGIAPGGKLHLFGATGTRETVNILKLEGSIASVSIPSKMQSEAHWEGPFTVSQPYQMAQFDRIERSLRRLHENQAGCSVEVLEALRGWPTKASRPILQLGEVVLPNGLVLNGPQLQAVRHATANAVSLIHGPPGTGKTLVAALVVVQIALQCRGRVLVTAHSNRAVRRTVQVLRSMHVPVVHILSRAQEEKTARMSESEHFCNMVQKFQILHEGEIKELEQKQSQATATQAEQLRLRDLTQDAGRLMLREASVIACTCQAAGDPKLTEFDGPQSFEYVLIDEASQVLTSSALIPICHGAQRICLVGDPCQLGARTSPELDATGFGMSLFEKLAKSNPGLTNYLTVQYRSHPVLVRFTSNAFYQNLLVNGVTPAERQPPKGFPTLRVHHVPGLEVLSATGTSYFNQKEASVVMQYLVGLRRASVPASAIGVVATYAAQVDYIKAKIRSKWGAWEELTVATVDSLQGEEKEVVILTFARSTRDASLGFLKEKRRLTVALTRARRSLIVIGNVDALQKDPYLRGLFEYAASLRGLKSGDLGKLEAHPLGKRPREIRESGLIELRPTPISIITASAQGVERVNAATLRARLADAKVQSSDRTSVLAVAEEPTVAPDRGSNNWVDPEEKSPCLFEVLTLQPVERASQFPLAKLRAARFILWAYRWFVTGMGYTATERFQCLPSTRKYSKQKMIQIRQLVTTHQRKMGSRGKVPRSMFRPQAKSTCPKSSLAGRQEFAAAEQRIREGPLALGAAYIAADAKVREANFEPQSVALLTHAGCGGGTLAATSLLDRRARATKERWPLDPTAPPSYQALLRDANRMGDAELRRQVPEIMEWTCDAHQGIPFSVLADLVDHLRRVHVVLYSASFTSETNSAPAFSAFLPSALLVSFAFIAWYSGLAPLHFATPPLPPLQMMWSRIRVAPAAPVHAQNLHATFGLTS